MGFALKRNIIRGTVGSEEGEIKRWRMRDISETGEGWREEW